MLLSNGKLYVALQQFFAPFANADGVDICRFLMLIRLLLNG